MAQGKTQYNLCVACHGQNGEGSPLAPPLANSEWVTGPWENLVKIQLRGLKGPIEVDGKVYDNLPAPMAPMGAGQPDENIAAVLTYIRNSFGNKADAVTPEQVKSLRSEEGKAMLTVADLIDPKSAQSTGGDTESKEYVKVEKPETDLPGDSVSNNMIFNVSFFVIIFLCIVAFFCCKGEKVIKR